MDASSDTPQPAAIAQRWETATRFYILALQQNLFGEWELMRAWGGRGTRLGSVRFDPAVSFEDAQRKLAREAGRRRVRGYAPHSARTFVP